MGALRPHTRRLCALCLQEWLKNEATDEEVYKVFREAMQNLDEYVCDSTGTTHTWIRF